MKERRRKMRGKYQFWLHFILILSLIINTITLLSPVAASPDAILAVWSQDYSGPEIIDTNLGPGSSFDIWIIVEYVEDLYGYWFKLRYNKDILNATAITLGSFFPPDAHIWKEEINRDIGYLEYSVSMPAGSPAGVSGSGILAIISFTVLSYGGTILDLYDTVLGNSPPNGGIAMPHVVIDGFFINALVHDIAIISVTPNATEVIQGETVNVNVVAGNEGWFTETFTVTAYASTTIIGTQDVTLDRGGQQPLTFPWDTTGVTLGEYIISANATTVPEETDTTDNTYVDLTITVIDYPVAAFNYSPMHPVVGEMVTFNASDSTPNGGYIQEHYWEFGDGFYWISLSPIAYHAYTSPGTYNVTLTITDSEDLTDTTSKLITIEPPKPISIYTDKYSYSAGEKMYLGLDIYNPLDSPITVCIAIWLEKPRYPRYLILHAHAVTLPAGFTYSNPTFKSYVLPSIPPGTYTWHAAILNPTTHTVYVEDTAEWQFI